MAGDREPRDPVLGRAAGDARAQVALDGYAISVVAHPIAYAWSSATARRRSVPGGVGRRTPRGRSTGAGVTTTWSCTWCGPAWPTPPAPAWGLDFGDQYLGTVTIGEPITYHTAEIRSLLRSRTVGR